MTKLTLVGRIACYKGILSVQLMLVLGIPHAFSQVAPAANSVIVSGVIKDGGDGKPLGAVTIEIAGIKQGDMSNEDGKFLIHAAPGATLTFRFVGYLPKDLKITGT